MVFFLAREVYDGGSPDAGSTISQDYGSYFFEGEERHENDKRFLLRRTGTMKTGSQSFF